MEPVTFIKLIHAAEVFLCVVWLALSLWFRLATPVSIVIAIEVIVHAIYKYWINSD